MHSRFRSHFPSHLTAAASALALVLMTAGISMVTFIMIAHPANPFYVLRLPYSRSTGNSLLLAVTMVIFGAYCTGVLAWILLFAAHRAGVQRLSGLETVARR
jgi:ABC-type thiamin/hydroxymethylpyrimidine transport system permease subunit